MGSCASLTSIELPYQNIIEKEDGEDVAALCTALASNARSLRYFDVGGNCGFGTDSGCQLVAAVISYCIATLQHISLPATGMTSSGLRHLTLALSNNTTMSNVMLDVSDNTRLGDHGARLLAELLHGCANVTMMGMRSIGMGIEGAQSLTHALKQHEPSISRYRGATS